MSALNFGQSVTGSTPKPQSCVIRPWTGTAMRRFRHAFFPLLVALAAMALPSASSAQMVDVTVAIAPPELPIYDQPEIPGPGYIWTPGFWAYGPDGYYWVPGTWVEATTVCLLWTPGYWG